MRKTSVISTTARDVLIVGAENVSDRFIQLIRLCLEVVADGEDHGVNLIVLSADDMPVQVVERPKEQWPEDKLLKKEPWRKLTTEAIMADCCMHAGAITINLPETFKEAFETVMERDNYSLYTLWWHNMLLNVLHEAVHCSQMACDDKPAAWLMDFMVDVDGFAGQVEKEAAKVADSLLVAIAKQYDIEPPAWGEEPFFARMALDTYSGDDGKDQQAVQWMNDRVFVYAETEGEPTPICSFRDYLRAVSNGLDDEEWDATVEQVEEPQPEQPAATPEVVETPAAGPTGFGGDTASAAAPAPQEYVEIEQGPEAVEDSTEGVMFAGASAGAFNMAPAEEMPSIPTNAPAPSVAPAPAPTPGFGGQPVTPAATVTPSAPAAARTIITPDNPVSNAPTVNASPAPTAPAAATAQTEPALQQVTNHNLSRDHILKQWYSVAGKCVEHIFRYCQFSASQIAPDLDDTEAYAAPDAVTKMPVKLTGEEAQVVVAAACLDDMGRWHQMRPTNDGQLFGMVTKKANIPMYKLYINFNGQLLCRTIIPQNVNKRYNGQLSKTAAQARAGHMIAFVYEGDDAVKQANPAISLKAKCVNGQWSLING